MRAKLKTKFSIGNYFFVLPAVLLNFVFFLFPFFQSLVMSFYDWPVLGEKTFVFLENYRALLEDTQFWHSLFFTLKYALFVTP